MAEELLADKEGLSIKKFFVIIFLIIAGLAVILSAVALVRDPSLIEKLPPHNEVRPYFLWSIGALSLAMIILACIKAYGERKPRIFVPKEPPRMPSQSESNSAFNPIVLAGSVKKRKHGSGKTKERDLLSW